MADFGISEATAATIATYASVAAAAAGVAGTGYSLYSADQTQQAQQAAANRSQSINDENQRKADEAQASYRQQAEQYRLKGYADAAAEAERQAGMQKEKDATLRKSLSEASIKHQLELLKGQESSVGADYSKSAITDATAIPGVDTGAAAADDAGTRVVSEGYKGAMDKVSAFLSGNAKGVAALDAISNSGQLAAIDQAHDQGDINKISNFMKGSAAVLPAEIGFDNMARSLIDQTAAENVGLFTRAQGVADANAARDINSAKLAGDTNSSIGSLLGSVGQLGTAYLGNRLGQPPRAKAVLGADGKPIVVNTKIH